MSVTYYLPAPRQNTGETQAKSSPDQGTSIRALWQALSPMMIRYRATLASLAVYASTVATAYLANGPTPALLPAAALVAAICSWETVHAPRSQPPGTRSRFVTAYAVAAVGGGYYGVAVELSRKPIWGPRRSHRHVALSDLHRLLEQIDPQ